VRNLQKQKGPRVIFEEPLLSIGQGDCTVWLP